MTMREPPSGLALVVTFAGLLVLAGVSWLAAAAGTGTTIALAIAAAKALAIALVFMELFRAHAVDRLVATIAVLFVILLCAGALADVAFR
jgi:caa(3)-type oxidase subunit IV